MRAVDTNVLVRFLVRDDEAQAQAARRTMLAKGGVYVATTVLLEAEWVLRSAYRLPSAEIQRLLREFAGLPDVMIEDRRLLADALDAMHHGLDFADALHLGRTNGCESFVTFDRALAKRAAKLSTVRIETL